MTCTAVNNVETPDCHTDSVYSGAYAVDASDWAADLTVAASDSTETPTGPTGCNGDQNVASSEPGVNPTVSTVPSTSVYIMSQFQDSPAQLVLDFLVKLVHPLNSTLQLVQISHIALHL